MSDVYEDAKLHQLRAWLSGCARSIITGIYAHPHARGLA